ncbi:acyl-CoA thioesterase [Hydrogenobaculum acidophilum]
MLERKTTYQRKVNFYETDAQGVVHHSNYFRYFEEARGYLLEHLGLPYYQMHNEGFFVVLVEAYIRIKHPIVYQDVFTIDTTIGIKNEFSLYFDYKVYVDDKLCAIGDTKHCIVKDGKLIKIPDFLLRILDDR